MTEVFTSILTLLTAAVGFFGGAGGIGFVTVAIAGTAIGCVIFHLPLHYLWKAAIVGAVCLAAGQIANGLAAGA